MLSPYFTQFCPRGNQKRIEFEVRSSISTQRCPQDIKVKGKRYEMGIIINYIVAIFLAKFLARQDFYYSWSSAFGPHHHSSFYRDKTSDICFDEKCSGMAGYRIFRIWFLPLCYHQAITLGLLGLESGKG